MKQETILKTVRSWAAALGHEEATLKLIAVRLSPRASEQIVAGTYQHRLRTSTMEKLELATGKKFLPAKKGK